MTAPGSGEQITAELVEALRQYGVGRSTAPRLAAVLLPVVEAYATRKAAEELRAAKAVAYRAHSAGEVHGWLRDRADALTSTHPDHGKAAT